MAFGCLWLCAFCVVGISGSKVIFREVYFARQRSRFCVLYEDCGFSALMLLPFQGAAWVMCAVTQGVASLALGYGLDGLSGCRIRIVFFPH